MPFNWTCPHCHRDQTVVAEKYADDNYSLNVTGSNVGSLVLHLKTIVCSNLDCRKPTIDAAVGGDAGAQVWRISKDKILFSQRLIPQGLAKPQPDYIPAALRDDYYEACLIRDFSPKASATLTRRCLQGMIRDFASIRKDTLFQEIIALREAVNEGRADRAISPETVEAIDHVRGVGNIGAHMEKDINLIVEVDSGEAQALIDLVELLFEEWYVAREIRKTRLARIAGIAEAKKIDRKAPLSAPAVDAFADLKGKETLKPGDGPLERITDQKRPDAALKS